MAKGTNDITSSILGLTKKKSMEERLEEALDLAKDNNFWCCCTFNCKRKNCNDTKLIDNNVFDIVVGGATQNTVGFQHDTFKGLTMNVADDESEIAKAKSEVGS